MYVCMYVCMHVYMIFCIHLCVRTFFFPGRLYVRIPGLPVLFDSQVVLGADEKAQELGEAGHSEYLYFLNDSSLLLCGQPLPHTHAHVSV
mmetsp:Transcript_19932/g.33902  ORF Transcript_19932/g.33902 Transcript_19932/m.33902 type:complete len:90 (-) Transcript_19932:537-806(-)